MRGGRHRHRPGASARPSPLPRCAHPALFSAMNELRQRNLTGLVDPRAFGGCWNPRLIRADDGISRHAWGAALDLNVNANPTGLASAQDPRLVEVMQRWGSTSAPTGWYPTRHISSTSSQPEVRHWDLHTEAARSDALACV